MAEKERDTSKLVHPRPPKGGTEVKGTQGEFYNIKEGEELTGTLLGSRDIPNDKGEMRPRYLLLVDKKTLILPDHYDLNDKLVSLLKLPAQPRKVWLAFCGFELNVPKVRGGKLARYDVQDMGEVK